jgi:phosphotransferase system enzyme I (PtsI)
MEFDKLSMNPQAVPRVKNLISRSFMKDCRRFVKKALQISTAEEIGDHLHDMMMKKFPEEFQIFDPSALVARPALPRAKRDL